MKVILYYLVDFSIREAYKWSLMEGESEIVGKSEMSIQTMNFYFNPRR